MNDTRSVSSKTLRPCGPGGIRRRRVMFNATQQMHAADRLYFRMLEDAARRLYQRLSTDVERWMPPESEDGSPQDGPVGRELFGEACLDMALCEEILKALHSGEHRELIAKHAPDTIRAINDRLRRYAAIELRCVQKEENDGR